jgi:hypothetical protein
MNDELSRPHTAVLNVQLECHSLLPDGMCSGRVLNSKALNRFGLKPSFLLRVDGIDAEDCLNRVQQKLKNWDTEAKP